jgi:hypothetical protein
MVGGLKNGEQEMIWNRYTRRFAAVRSGVGDCVMLGDVDEIRTELLRNTNLMR